VSRSIADGELNGQIANRGALDVATANLESGGSLREPVEQRIAAATTTM